MIIIKACEWCNDNDNDNDNGNGNGNGNGNDNDSDSDYDDDDNNDNGILMIVAIILIATILMMMVMLMTRKIIMADDDIKIVCLLTDSHKREFGNYYRHWLQLSKYLQYIEVCWGFLR